MEEKNINEDLLNQKFKGVDNVKEITQEIETHMKEEDERRFREEEEKRREEDALVNRSLNDEENRMVR